MERESNPMQALCRSGCGFYGSPATDGLCSLCYKENLKKKQQPPVSAATVPASQTASGNVAGALQGGFGNPASTGTTAQPTIPTIPQSTTDLPNPKEVSIVLPQLLFLFVKEDYLLLSWIQHPSRFDK